MLTIVHICIESYAWMCNSLLATLQEAIMLTSTVIGVSTSMLPSLSKQMMMFYHLLVLHIYDLYLVVIAKQTAITVNKQSQKSLFSNFFSYFLESQNKKLYRECQHERMN